MNISVLLGCHRTTVSRWFTIYKKSGIEGLLSKTKNTGRPRKIPAIVEEKLRSELEVVEGFNSYGEVQTWKYMGY